MNTTMKHFTNPAVIAMLALCSIASLWFFCDKVIQIRAQYAAMVQQEESSTLGSFDECVQVVTGGNEAHGFWGADYCFNFYQQGILQQYYPYPQNDADE
jgi:hypothetical protein